MNKDMDDTLNQVLSGCDKYMWDRDCLDVGHTEIYIIY